MGYVAKLVRGAQYLDLASGRYSLGRDFKPGVSSFSVKVSGSSSAEVRRGVDDINLFLSYCGDTANPTYFEWLPDNNVSAQPVWGQGLRRVELLGGSLEYWDEYFEASVREAVAFVRVSLSYGSTVEGVRQLAATATGGVVEDWIGMPDGQSRGLQIPEGDAANGNKMTNPIFGHSTWNNGWTAGSTIVSSQNTKPEFIVHGLNSAKISYNTGTASQFTMSINPGTATVHTLSCYAKLPNSGSIGTANIQLFCGSLISTTYKSAGDGWYRCYGTVMAGTSAVNVGVDLKTKNTVYVDAFQLEDRAYPTAFFYGDMIGCAWAGTNHASKSTRTTPYLRIPTSQINPASGTIRIIWKADKSNTAFSGQVFLLYSSSAFYLSYEGAIASWDFGIAGAGATSADTFSDGSIRVIYLTWDPDGYSIFVNNSQTNGTYSFPVLGTYLYMCTDDAPDTSIGGTVMDLSIWTHKMTTAQVSADYTNVLQIINDGEGLGGILYAWDKDGDGVADNVDSSTQQNWVVIGGIPGDLPAKVEASLTTGGMNDADVYLSRLDVPYNYWVDPEFLTYATLGTVSVGASNVGLATIGMDSDEFRIIAGRKMAIMVRGVEGTSNNISLRTGINPGGAYYYSAGLSSNWGTAGGTNTRIDMSPEIFMVDEEEYYRILGYYCNATAVVQASRSSGSANFVVNSAQIMPYPLTRFRNLSASGTPVTIAYIDGKAYEVNGSALYYTYQVDGAQVELIPNRYNLLTSYLGREGSLSEPADTLTYRAVYVTPRWKMF